MRLELSIGHYIEEKMVAIMVSLYFKGLTKLWVKTRDGEIALR